MEVEGDPAGRLKFTACGLSGFDGLEWNGMEWRVEGVESSISGIEGRW